MTIILFLWSRPIINFNIRIRNPFAMASNYPPLSEKNEKNVKFMGGGGRSQPMKLRCIKKLAIEEIALSQTGLLWLSLLSF
jgi:hypothetical protein